MAADWEKEAVVQELTERITAGDFAGDFDALKQAVEAADLLSERDRQQLLQYWVSKERERKQRNAAQDGSGEADPS